MNYAHATGRVASAVGSKTNPRANKETFYFAKFDCPLSQDLEKTLKKAQK